MDSRIELIKSRIRDYPDFPKAGVLFKDVFSVFGDAEALDALCQVLREKARAAKGQVDVIVGLDARGFLMGPIMAQEIGVPFVPVSWTIFGVVLLVRNKLLMYIGIFS